MNVNSFKAIFVGHSKVLVQYLIAVTMYRCSLRTKYDTKKRNRLPDGTIKTTVLREGLLCILDTGKMHNWCGMEN